MEEIKKSEDYMNMSLSVSPEKYFDSRFDGQEKLFIEKFNGQKARFDERFNSLETKFDVRIDNLEAQLNGRIDGLEAKIDALYKMLTFGFGVIIAVLAVLVALHFLGR